MTTQTPIQTTDPDVLAQRAYVQALAKNGQLSPLLNRKDTTPLVAMWAADQSYLTDRDMLRQNFYDAGFDVVVPYNIKHTHKGHGDSTIEAVIAIDYDTYNEQGQRQPTIIVAFRGTDDESAARAVEEKRAKDGWKSNDYIVLSDSKLVPTDRWPDSQGSLTHDGMKEELDMVQDGLFHLVDRMVERSYRVTSVPPRIIVTGHSKGAQTAADFAVREANRYANFSPETKLRVEYYGIAAPAYLNSKAAAYAAPRLDVARNYLINGVMVQDPKTGKMVETKPDVIDEIRTANHKLHHDDLRPIGTQVLLDNDAVPLAPQATSIDRHDPRNYLDNMAVEVFRPLGGADTAALDAALAPVQQNAAALKAQRQAAMVVPATQESVTVAVTSDSGAGKVAASTVEQTPTASATSPRSEMIDGQLSAAQNQVSNTAPEVLAAAPAPLHDDSDKGPDGYDATRPLPALEWSPLLDTLKKIITSPLRFTYHVLTTPPSANDLSQLPVQQDLPKQTPPGRIISPGGH